MDDCVSLAGDSAAHPPVAVSSDLPRHMRSSRRPVSPRAFGGRRLGWAQRLLAGSRPHTASRTNGADDFDGWVVGPVLNLVSPLFCEARYLLAEEPDMRDPALYRPCKEGQTIDQCWREEFVFVSCVTGDLFDDEAVVRSSPPSPRRRCRRRLASW